MASLKTSLVIPCYFKDESFLKMTQACVESLEYERPDETIIVDDGSPFLVDYKHWMLHYPGVRCAMTGENKGFPGAVNFGLEKATGNILIVANNDILFTPNWLTELLKPLEEGFDISSIVTSDQGWETEDKITQDDRFGSLWAMKRKVYETIGGLDEQFGTGTFEDADYYLRAKRAGFLVGKNWNCLVEHKGRATFDAVDPGHKIFEQNRKLFYKKWGFVI